MKRKKLKIFLTGKFGLKSRPPTRYTLVCDDSKKRGVCGRKRGNVASVFGFDENKIVDVTLKYKVG